MTKEEETFLKQKKPREQQKILITQTHNKYNHKTTFEKQFVQHIIIKMAYVLNIIIVNDDNDSDDDKINSVTFLPVKNTSI